LAPHEYNSAPEYISFPVSNSVNRPGPKLLTACARILNVPPPGETVMGEAEPVAPELAPVLSSIAVTINDVIAPSPVSAGGSNETVAEPMLVLTLKPVGAFGVLRGVKVPSVPPCLRDIAHSSVKIFPHN
jgi:hypothetical protein